MVTFITFDSVAEVFELPVGKLWNHKISCREGITYMAYGIKELSNILSKGK